MKIFAKMIIAARSYNKGKMKFAAGSFLQHPCKFCFGIKTWWFRLISIEHVVHMPACTYESVSVFE